MSEKFKLKYVRRLLKVARHLERGKLGHDRFDFGCITEKTTCGTVGCAMGELPYIWPKQWRFNDEVFGGIIQRGFPSDIVGFCKSVEEWFGINDYERLHLFYPNRQYTDLYGGTDLDEHSTKEDVASNIREFLRKKLSTD